MKQRYRFPDPTAAFGFFASALHVVATCDDVRMYGLVVEVSFPLCDADELPGLLRVFSDMAKRKNGWLNHSDVTTKVVP